MRIVCAWCGRIMVHGPGEVSHGMCVECEARVVSAVEEFQREAEVPVSPRIARGCVARRPAAPDSALEHVV